MSKNGRVLVAMSGGIDSTVTAIMLKDAGYDVVGITMKTWDYATSNVNGKETGCCSLDSINDARAISVKHGIHHMILDIRDEFGGHVIDDFVDEYMAGRTPNPCILCNTHIKWEALLKRADMLDCEFIATGHYANVNIHDNGRYYVSKGLDDNKDQSYVLWGLAQKNLARTMFPMGKYHKTDIKQMAIDMGYEELAKKSESYEICFIPDNDYRSFLRNKVDNFDEKYGAGDFVRTDGTVVGRHKGFPFYTVGQRKGLGISSNTPLYVLGIKPDTNTVVVGTEDELWRNGMLVRGVNMQKYESLPADYDAVTKIRYKSPGTNSALHYDADSKTMKVIFNPGVSGITPGQSAVFYEGDHVIGGGRIDSSFSLDVNN